MVGRNGQQPLTSEIAILMVDRHKIDAQFSKPYALFQIQATFWTAFIHFYHKAGGLHVCNAKLDWLISDAD